MLPYVAWVDAAQVLKCAYLPYQPNADNRSDLTLFRIADFDALCILLFWSALINWIWIKRYVVPYLAKNYVAGKGSVFGTAA